MKIRIAPGLFVAMPAFAVLGGAHVDHLAQADGPMEAGASNPGRVRRSIGGAAFNAAFALRMFEAPVEFLGIRGGDAAGGDVAAALEGLGIGDRSVTFLDRQTPSYTAILDRAGELQTGIAAMSLYDALGRRQLARRSVRDWLGAADAVLMDANLPAEALARLSRDAPGRQAAIGVSPAKIGRLDAILPRLDVLFLSRREALALTDAEQSATVASLARRLADRGLRRAVVTDGPRPAAILNNGIVHHQIPPSVPTIVDVTGAGDTLAAIAFLAWLQGQAFPDAVRLGMAAASLRITARLQPGCRPACAAIAAAMPPASASTGQDA